jgi:DNA-binding NtrC family response regulator
VPDLLKELQCGFFCRGIDMQLFNTMIRTARMTGDTKAPVLGGNSMAAHALRQMVIIAAGSFDPVQLCGAGGTGFVDLAQAIHEQSEHRTEPFVDASQGDLGDDHFAIRWVGTLFLGDVSRLSRLVQASLLEWMDSPDGATVRVISAQSPQIASACHILPELQAKLTVVSIPFPALQQRQDDIPAILQRLWATSSFPLPPIFNRSAWAAVLQHDWSGNFGELKEFSEKMSRQYGGRSVSSEEILRALGGNSNGFGRMPSSNLRQHLAEEEKLFLIEALLRSRGVVQQAATLSGLKRTTFLAKMKRHGLARL